MNRRNERKEMTTAMTKQDAHPVNKSSPLYALANKFSIEPAKLVEVLRGTVIKPDRNGKAATNEEMAAFCIVADQYGLNPFTREIHAFASGDKGIVPIVGIDGWTKVVNARGDFDGCEFDEIADEQGQPVSITCRMYVKGRSHPVCATERFAECARKSIPWQSMPWRMLRHKAYMQAARYAFGLSGIYDQDEANDIMRNRQSQPMKAAEVVEKETVDLLKGNATATEEPPAIDVEEVP
jgi:phage recombination protein Bet